MLFIIKFKFNKIKYRIQVAVNKKPKSRKEAFKMIVRNIYESIKKDIMQAKEVKILIKFQL